MKNEHQTHQKKIGIVICYLGQLPWYFDYFVHSCKFNPTITIFFVSDCQYGKELPKNFRIISKTQVELNNHFTDKLGFQVNITHGYKLNDFKPAYGILFSELLEGYDFWAHSDIDLIFGNLRYFLTDEFLNHYDFINVRHDYTTGCFVVYRNTELVNTLFRRSKDYVRVFSSAEHFCFDECNFVYLPLMDGLSIFDVPTEIESFTHVIKRADLEGKIRAHFDFILLEGAPGKIRFDHGRVIYRQKIEVILYHLCWFKRHYNPVKSPKTIPDFYCVSPTRIYSKSLSS